MNPLQQWCDAIAKEFVHIFRKQVTNAPKLEHYVQTCLRTTPGCSRSVYSIKNGLHACHVTTGEMVRALRKAGYTVQDDLCNATEAE